MGFVVFTVQSLTFTRNAIGLPPPPQAVDNGLYLPRGSNVFITTTKSGKPAFARKKKNDLLQDFGFDIFGQSFGIPSRADLERQPRHIRHASQSSGVITVPTTPRYFPEKVTLHNDGTESEPEELPLVSRARKGDSVRPSTPLRGILKHPRDRAGSGTYNGSYNYGMEYPSSPFQSFQPPAPPPATPFHWPQHGASVMSAATPSPSHHLPPPHQNVAHVPGYPSQVSYCNGSPSWMSPPPTSQWSGPLDFTAPQMTSMPGQPSPPHWAPSYSYAAPATYFMPAQTPSSSVPAMSAFQGPAITATPQNQPNLVANKTRHISNRIDSRAAPKSLASGKENKSSPQNKTNDNVEAASGISKRIRHHHICAGCGKRRSREYQNAHPLKRGEMPEPAYCTRCIRDAEFSSPFLSDTEHIDVSISLGHNE